MCGVCTCVRVCLRVCVRAPPGSSSSLSCALLRTSQMGPERPVVQKKNQGTPRSPFPWPGCLTGQWNIFFTPDLDNLSKSSELMCRLRSPSGGPRPTHGEAGFACVQGHLGPVPCSMGGRHRVSDSTPLDKQGGSQRALGWASGRTGWDSDPQEHSGSGQAGDLSTGETKSLTACVSV